MHHVPLSITMMSPMFRTLYCMRQVYGISMMSVSVMFCMLYRYLTVRVYVCFPLSPELAREAVVLLQVRGGSSSDWHALDVRERDNRHLHPVGTTSLWCVQAVRLPHWNSTSAPCELLLWVMWQPCNDHVILYESHVILMLLLMSCSYLLWLTTRVDGIIMMRKMWKGR